MHPGEKPMRREYLFVVGVATVEMEIVIGDATTSADVFCGDGSRTNGTDGSGFNGTREDSGKIVDKGRRSVWVALGISDVDVGVEVRSHTSKLTWAR